MTCTKSTTAEQQDEIREQIAREATLNAAALLGPLRSAIQSEIPMDGLPRAIDELMSRVGELLGAAISAREDDIAKPADLYRIVMRRPLEPAHA